MAKQAQLFIRVWNAPEKREDVAHLTRQNFGVVFSFVGMWDLIQDAARVGDLVPLFPRNGADLGSLIEIELKYYHGMLSHCCSRRSALGAGGRIDLDRLQKMLCAGWGGSGAFFSAKNRALLQQALDECPEIHAFEQAYALFLVFVCMHMFAQADIGQPGTLDRDGAWKPLLIRAAKAAAAPAVANGYREKYGATAYEGGVVRLPLYAGDGELPGPLKIVRLAPLSNDTKAFQLGDGVRRALKQGQPLYALRLSRGYVAFLPEAFHSMDARMERDSDEPGTLALTRNGERVDVAIPGPGLPASWAYLPAREGQLEGAVCVRDDRALFLIGDVRLPDPPPEAVQVCAAGAALYALRPDGTVYSNMAGADGLKRIVCMNASPNRALFVDAGRKLWTLSPDGRACEVSGAGEVADIRREADDSFVLIDRNGVEKALKR